MSTSPSLRLVVSREDSTPALSKPPEASKNSRKTRASSPGLPADWRAKSFGDKLQILAALSPDDLESLEVLVEYTIEDILNEGAALG
jgi:hypothetical protein